ncbi:helix-turn-helix domain-containing protein [uncultured Sphingomonas sp.]|uniref:helix-turn-helix domain-containing protein n=1 Tax=uncultured Sphingomonas sp. TaxID=158754 RepID=UPI002605D587|nr:helix-turn-helix domain-containing protein [uncultured Sphingomonas sp.]
MATVLESNKTKIAKRVIEVFEYFGPTKRSATVMDIVRRYDRPQSSTSELLASLVEMGLLYKDPVSRSYSPTPRLATLGSTAQPDLLRDGRIYAFMDRLAQSTRCGVGLFGMVGTHAQIFRWSPGADQMSDGVESGASESLSGSAVGLLLLSTFGPEKARKLLWRLNAEAAPEQRFDYASTTQRVVDYARAGAATGEAGFVAGASVTAVMLPHGLNERPLALGVIHPGTASIDTEALVATMRHELAQNGTSEPFMLPHVGMPLMRAI